MPAGLDGNPDPIVTPERDQVLNTIADRVLEHRGPRTLVAVDGQPGAGKSTFADELAWRLSRAGRTTLRSTTDSFHRPRAERLRRGPMSAGGYYLDSHQLEVIVDDLLRPFAEGAAKVRTAAFDEPSDSALDVSEVVESGAVLIFDGLFVQRPEFACFWHLTIFLDARRRRDGEWLGFLLGDLPEDAVERAAAIDDRLTRARWPRYRDGWRRYVETVQPATSATFRVDNNDLSKPMIV
jgi:uridine kinase